MNSITNTQANAMMDEMAHNIIIKLDNYGIIDAPVIADDDTMLAHFTNFLNEVTRANFTIVCNVLDIELVEVDE